MTEGEGHVIKKPLQYTWRQAAVHWREGRGGWEVFGSHYEKIDGKTKLEAMESVTDCSIYDG